MKRKTLRDFLLRWAVVFLIAGITLTGSVAVALMVRFFSAEIRERNRLAIDLVVTYLDEHFRTHRRTLEFLAEKNDTGENLLDITLYRGGFYRLIQTDFSGIVLFCGPDCEQRKGFDISRQPYFPGYALSRGSTWWSRVFFDELQGKSAIALSVAGENGYWIGFLDLEHLREIFAPVTNKSKTVFALVDQLGSYIYCSDSTAVPQREGLNVRWTRLISNDEWLVAQIPQIGWSVVLQRDRGAQYYPIWVSVSSVIGIAGFLLLVLSYLVTAGIRRVFAPLRVLLDSTRRLAMGGRGSLSEEVREWAAVAQYDELTELYEGFHIMAREIREQAERLENLNRDLEEELEQNRSSAQAFTTLMAALSGCTGEALLQVVASSLRVWLQCDFALVGFVQEDGRLHLRGHAGLEAENPREEMDIPSSPFAPTLKDGHYECLCGALDLFPACALLRDHGLDGYAGVAIEDEGGKNIGIIAVLSRSPMTKPMRFREVMAILAGRVSAEMIRMQQEANLVELNRNLSELTEALSLRNKDMESMLFATSHDLKAPLVNIAGFSRELGELVAELDSWLSQPDSAEKERRLERLMREEIPECHHYILHAVQRMDRLLNGLLRLFRLSRHTLQREPVDLSLLVDKLRTVLAFEMQQVNAQLIIENIPMVLGDPEELSQVIQNLLSNAIKYRHPERDPVIRIFGFVVDDMVEVVCEDNGRGIAAADLDKIFQLFFRSGEVRDITGDGIGLALCQRIAVRHGGSIRVESQFGEWTRFILRLPAAR